MDYQKSLLSDDKKGNWISEQTSNSYVVSGTSEELTLIKELIDAVYNYPYPKGMSKVEVKNLRGKLLAAAFDLLVSAEYYKSMGHSGWVYCPFPEDKPFIYYPYTNVCPRCVLNNDFRFHQANKPPSGSIGAITSKLLGLFFENLFKRHGKQVEIHKGSEPVDTIFIDKKTNPPVYLFVEIKSAPLLTLPLAVKTEKLTQEIDSSAKSLLSHEKINITPLYQTPINILVPIKNTKSSSKWDAKLYLLGSKANERDLEWAYKGLINLLRTDNKFFFTYSNFWLEALDEYQNESKVKQSVYWFTNGCGQPSPRPDTWPKRSSGSGYESVSDGKTSVGMDRTDDIKKATYQVLKLGSEGKTEKGKKYLVGIVSNIHAVRHFDEYLKNMKDIIWTKDETGNITKASQLAPDTEFYNLFDGIISLTQIVARDSWIKETFDF